jgi:ecotropic viral integration site 5 protein
MNDSIGMRVTPFMLDNFAHEYEELVRVRDAHVNEVNALRQTNRSLAAQM